MLEKLPEKLRKNIRRLSTMQTLKRCQSADGKQMRIYIKKTENSVEKIMQNLKIQHIYCRKK